MKISILLPLGVFGESERGRGAGKMHCTQAEKRNAVTQSEKLLNTARLLYLLSGVVLI